jgi:hypothetical protein
MWSFPKLVRSAATVRGVRPLIVGMTITFLVGCGGGGGDTPPPLPPTSFNHAPAFTSASAIAVPENVTGSIYQAAATDADANPVTFSISGGADAARFTITPAGQLSFVASPNFDLPADSDGDNVYQVAIAASDGQASATLILSVTVSNSKEGIATHRVGTGFVNPAAMAPVTDTNVLVAERSGAIYAFNPQDGSRQLLVQITNVGGPGVVAIAAAPDFAAKGKFVAMYATANGFLVVSEFLRNPAGPTVPNNFGPLMAVSAPQYPGGGWLGFDSSGNLIIATADAGGSGDPTGSAQDDSSRLGKIIRAAPNPDPFAGATAVFYLLSTVAKGVHQPNGGALFAGGLFIPDGGQTISEEVDLLPANGGTINFGWPFKEGTHVVQGTPPAGVVDPVIEYARASGTAPQGIIGGAIAGNAVPSLTGQYVFADRSGTIFSAAASALQNGQTLTLSSIERRTLDFAPDAGTIDAPVAVVGDAAGRFYILDADGEIFRVDAG